MNQAVTESSAAESRAAEFRSVFQDIQSNLSKVIAGQNELLSSMLVAFFAGGHVLLEGVPGLGKTLLVRTLARTIQLPFARIQFTPDLMPSDIVGTRLIVESDSGGRGFEFQKGPVFSSILLADEINRATPKTQSALLEAMQEGHVTIAGVEHVLPQPFFVMATQNPLEMEGTYPLPEAQLDRFFFKLQVPYPDAEEMHIILDRTTAGVSPEVDAVVKDPSSILELRAFARTVHVERSVQDAAIQLVLATHPDSANASESCQRFVRYGASPRAAQAMIIAAKIHALLDNRYHVSNADIRLASTHALRHRIILNFEGQAENITPEEIIAEAVASHL